MNQIIHTLTLLLGLVGREAATETLALLYDVTSCIIWNGQDLTQELTQGLTQELSGIDRNWQELTQCYANYSTNIDLRVSSVKYL
jgi:hypothetical protein